MHKRKVLIVTGRRARVCSTASSCVVWQLSRDTRGQSAGPLLMDMFTDKQMKDTHTHTDRQSRGSLCLSVPVLLREDILARQNGNVRTIVLYNWKAAEIILVRQKNDDAPAPTFVCVCMNDSCRSTTQKLTLSRRVILRIIFTWRLEVVHIMSDRIPASKHRLKDKGNNYLSFMCLSFLFSLLWLLNMFLTKTSKKPFNQLSWQTLSWRKKWKRFLWFHTQEKGKRNICYLPTVGLNELKRVTWMNFSGWS